MCVRACEGACESACASACECACGHACVYVSVYVSVRVCLCACVCVCECVSPQCWAESFCERAISLEQILAFLAADNGGISAQRCATLLFNTDGIGSDRAQGLCDSVVRLECLLPPVLFELSFTC